VSETLPLNGFRVGVTAARKVDEQIALLERRGASVEWAPALSLDPNHVDDDHLRAATEEVLAAPVDMFVATTGIGMKSRFEAAERWDLLPKLLDALGPAEILARGPKTVGALRRRGLREVRTPQLEDVLQPGRQEGLVSNIRAIPTEPEAAELGQGRVLVIIGALLLGMLLAALDQTIVATALPTIAGDLHGLSELSWVVTAYILASTASTPLWGKLGDLYGRKAFFRLRS
jgi:hypothetical protein